MGGPAKRSRRGALFALVCLMAAGPDARGAQPVVVESADPPEAEQGTFGLDVTISGRGFDEGSVAEFLVTGTPNPGGVVVQSTTFLSSKKLVARIDVDVEAVVSLYDIQVTTSRGRRGKGTETFAVREQGSGGSPDQIVIQGTFRDALTDRYLPDGDPAAYEDQMPDTGNLVFQPASRTFLLRLLDDPETIELDGECDDNPAEVCLRDGSTRVNSSYQPGFLSINMLDPGGLDCAGGAFPIAPRDMLAGECIQVFVSSSMFHPGAKPAVQLRLRCGKHPWEGDDRMRLECLDSDGEGCLLWDLRPFLDGAGGEHLTCQLYDLARKGNETNLELAEYDIVFAMTIARQ